MDELLTVVRDVSPFLKIGWAGWLLWAVVQIAWYRFGRRAPSPVVRAWLPPPPAVREPRARRVPVEPTAPLAMTIEPS
jgi:hypothetical protein